MKNILPFLFLSVALGVAFGADNDVELYQKNASNVNEIKTVASVPGNVIGFDGAGDVTSFPVTGSNYATSDLTSTGVRKHSWVHDQIEIFDGAQHQRNFTNSFLPGSLFFDIRESLGGSKYSALGSGGINSTRSFGAGLWELDLNNGIAEGDVGLRSDKMFFQSRTIALGSQPTSFLSLVGGDKDGFNLLFSSQWPTTGTKVAVQGRNNASNSTELFLQTGAIGRSEGKIAGDVLTLIDPATGEAEWETPTAPSPVNLYNSDGILTGNRKVVTDSFDLVFTDGGSGGDFDISNTEGSYINSLSIGSGMFGFPVTGAGISSLDTTGNIFAYNYAGDATLTGGPPIMSQIGINDALGGGSTNGILQTFADSGNYYVNVSLDDNSTRLSLTHDLTNATTTWEARTPTEKTYINQTPKLLELNQSLGVYRISQPPVDDTDSNNSVITRDNATGDLELSSPSQIMVNLPQYASLADATTAGLVSGDWYKTSTSINGDTLLVAVQIP